MPTKFSVPTELQLLERIEVALGGTPPAPGSSKRTRIEVLERITERFEGGAGGGGGGGGAVLSVAGKTGVVALVVADVTGAAPLASPAFTGNPTAPTQPSANSSTRIATTAFVKNQGYVTAPEASALGPVQSVAGRTGVIVLSVSDITGAAPLTSPNFTGTPTAPTPPVGDDSGRLATTAWVKSQGYGTGGLGAFAITEVSPGYPLTEWMRQYAAGFGVPTAFGEDDRALLQRAWLWSAQEGKPIAHMEPSLISITSQIPAGVTDWDAAGAAGDARRLLILENGMQFFAGPRTRIEGPLSSSIGIHALVIARRNNTGIGTPSLRPVVRIEGGTWGKPGSVSGGYYTGGLNGSIFKALLGKGSVFRDVLVDGWGNGDPFGFAGDGITMERCMTRNYAQEPGTGGIRFYFGRDFVADNCDIESYDDALQFVPLGSTYIGQWGSNTPIIENSVYRNCKGHSKASRWCIAAIPDDGQGPTPARIINCGFENCHATSEVGNVLAVRNEAGQTERAIDNIWFKNVSARQRVSTEASDRNAIDMFGGSNFAGATVTDPESPINGQVLPAMGSVGLVTLDRVVVEEYNSRSIRTDGKIRELRINDLQVMGNGTNELAHAATFWGVDRLFVTNSTFRGVENGLLDCVVIGDVDGQVGTGANSLHLGQIPNPAYTFPGTTPVKRDVGYALFENTWAVDIGPNRYGFVFNRMALGAEMRFCGVRGGPSVTTARAISHAGAAAGKLIINDSDWTGAGNATPFNLTGRPGLYEFGFGNLGVPAALRGLKNARTRRGIVPIPAKWYPLLPDGASHASASAVPAADTLYLYPFKLDAPMTIEALGLRTAATGGGTARMSIWEDGVAGVPTGLPVVTLNEAVSVAATSSNIQTTTPADLNVTLEEGMYWIGVVVHGALPICHHLGASQNLTKYVGGTTIATASQTPHGAYTTPLLAATNITTLNLTGATLTSSVVVGIPIVYAKAK